MLWRGGHRSFKAGRQPLFHSERRCFDNRCSDSRYSDNPYSDNKNVMPNGCLFIEHLYSHTWRVAVTYKVSGTRNFQLWLIHTGDEVHKKVDGGSQKVDLVQCQFRWNYSLGTWQARRARASTEVLGAYPQKGPGQSSRWEAREAPLTWKLSRFWVTTNICAIVHCWTRNITEYKIPI